MKETSCAKLLDAWNAPAESGEPIGLMATTFTFDAIFFEEECLGRFLNMQSDPNSDGPIYLIELEEKLSGLKCAVLVDQHHCKGARNLRWDLIPARSKNWGILHAKISILYWSNLIRIIVTSANLTEKGYRENQEIFGIVDFSADNEFSYNVLEAYLDYMNYVISETTNRKDGPEITSWQELISKIKIVSRQWEKSQVQGKKNEIQLFPLLIKPGGENVFEQLIKIWGNNARGVINNIIVTSPFFNDPEDKFNLPAKMVWDLLSKRGSVTVTYNVPVENVDVLTNETTLRAPSTLNMYVPPLRNDVKVDFRILREVFENGKDEFIRFIHLKSIVLKNNEWIVYMIGSSNFTSAGLGLPGSQNFEANLVYVVSGRNYEGFKEIKNSILLGDRVKGKSRFLENAIRNNEDEPDESDILPLPEFFYSLIYSHKEGNKIIMSFSGLPPEGFTILNEEGVKLFDEQLWLIEGKPVKYLIDWKNKPIPAGLYVKWTRSIGSAYWPLIIEDKNLLLPPEDLRNLSLDILINIITSARPLYQIIRNWQRGKEHKEYKYSINEILDPHKKVDTSTFILQRTRKVSDALYGLKLRLERPVYTKESLYWRLYGPIGVKTIANAILKEGRSGDEKAFLLCETALEISRINYTESINSLQKSEVQVELINLINELKKESLPYQKNLNANMKKYIKRAFKTSLK
jgi:hypothetical protein